MHNRSGIILVICRLPFYINQWFDTLYLYFFLIKLFYYVYMVFIDKRFRACRLKYRTNISHFFHFNLKSASLPIFNDENTSLASFPCFFNFNLKSALPIFINENTNHFLHLIGRKIASYLFSLYLGTNLLHFPFFPL